MSYASLADLVSRFGEQELIQLTDTENVGEIDTLTVSKALADADAEIDAALRGRYQLPLSTTPELVVRIACELTREALYADSPSETVKDRAKNARLLLTGIASGKMRLEAPAAVQAESTSGLVEMVSGRKHSPFGG